MLLTAEAVFAEFGFGAATLEEVARRLEMRRASLGYYFDDKEALFDAVFREILADLHERLRPALEHDDPIEGMESLASLWVDFLQARPHAGRVLLRQLVDGLPPRRPATRRRFADFVGDLSGLIERGAQSHAFKRIDPGEYGAILAGTSLLWVSARETLQRAYGFDSMAPERIEGLRHRLVQLTRQLIEAPQER